MKPGDFNIIELVEELQGTCKSIIDFLPEGMSEEDLTEEDLDYIENEIFLCTTCGWWCEISQSTESNDGEHECDNCNDEEE